MPSGETCMSAQLVFVVQSSGKVVIVWIGFNVPLSELYINAVIVESNSLMAYAKFFVG